MCEQCVCEQRGVCGSERADSVCERAESAWDRASRFVSERTERERERETVCVRVCVCVCERERERAEIV